VGEQDRWRDADKFVLRLQQKMAWFLDAYIYQEKVRLPLSIVIGS
jgi:hypothetical protein